jgi:hypothetical protein
MGRWVADARDYVGRFGELTRPIKRPHQPALAASPDGGA